MINTQNMPTPAIPAALAAGQAAVPSLILNAQATVQVTVKPTLPGAYNPVAFTSGGLSILANLSVVSVTAVSGSRVDVTVKNVGVATIAGATVVVIATT